MRLDKFLVEYKFLRSRVMSQEFIKNQLVFVNDKLIVDVKFDINEVDYNNKKIKVFIKSTNKIYVSRGAYKLLGAIEDFDLSKEFFDNKICLDIGSSTGGFTEVLLDNNVQCVYAVDVGKDQFDKSLLKQNTRPILIQDRVLLFENTDIRYFADIQDPNMNHYSDLEGSENSYFDSRESNHLYQEFFDIIVGDVSFISLFKVLPSVQKLLKKNGNFIFLLKPQFELENREDKKKYQNDNGIIKQEYKEEFYTNLLEKYKSYFKVNNLNIINITKSKIKGGDGNEEFVIFGYK